MKKIGIVGYGYVGRAMARFFENHYEVYVHDTDPDLRLRLDSPKHIVTDQDTINSCDLAVICVPTPPRNDGRCEVRLVDSALQWLRTPLILLKSTVPPGSTERWANHINPTGNLDGPALVFSPEFCGESSYWTPYDFHTSIVDTPFFVFGGQPEYTSKLVDLYMHVAGPTKRYIQTTAKVAEMAKYTENCFYATKIAFCYEIAEVCRSMDLDWNAVRDIWLLDPRINPMHTAVFAENDAPFGGKCLPKDLAGLRARARELSVSTPVLDGIERANLVHGRRRAERRQAII